MIIVRSENDRNAFRLRTKNKINQLNIRIISVNFQTIDAHFSALYKNAHWMNRQEDDRESCPEWYEEVTEEKKIKHEPDLWPLN